MRNLLWNLLFIIVGLIFAACSRQEPENLLSEGQNAFKIEGDYVKAMELFQQVSDWEKDGGPDRDQRFEAAYMIILCRIKWGTLPGYRVISKK